MIVISACRLWSDVRSLQHERQEWEAELGRLLAAYRSLEARHAVLARHVLELAAETGEPLPPVEAAALPDDPPGFAERVADYERTLITEALARADGCQRRAAALLGLQATTLHEKLKRLGLTAPHGH